MLRPQCPEETVIDLSPLKVLVTTGAMIASNNMSLNLKNIKCNYFSSFVIIITIINVIHHDYFDRCYYQHNYYYY